MPGLLEALREYDIGSRMMMAGAHLEGQPGAANAIMLAMMERKERRALDAKRAATIQKIVAKRPELAPLFEANPEAVDSYFTDEYKAKQAQELELAREKRRQEATLAEEARRNQYLLEQEQRNQEYTIAGEGRKTEAQIAQEERARADALAQEERANAVRLAEEARKQKFEAEQAIVKEKLERETNALKNAADPNTIFRNQFQQKVQDFELPGAGMQGAKPRELVAAQSMSGMPDMTPAEAAQYHAGSMAGPEHQATALRAIHDDRRQAANANLTTDYRNYLLAGGDAAYPQGGFAQYQQEQKGGMIVRDPVTGNVILDTTGGKNSGSRTSEDQRKGADLLIRAKEMSPKIDELEKDLINYTALASSVGAEIPLVGNYLQSDKYREGINAGIIWVNSVKRRDSGAALQIYESEQYNKMFIPQPGDDPATLANKRRARKSAEKGMEMGLTEEQILKMVGAEGVATAENPNPGIDTSDAPTAPDAPDDGVYTFNPETGKLE